MFLNSYKRVYDAFNKEGVKLKENLEPENYTLFSIKNFLLTGPG